MYIVEGNQVFEETDFHTQSQTVKVKKFHDLTYHTELTQNGNTITATLKNYMGEVHHYTGPMHFIIDGDLDNDETITVDAVDGSASFNFISEVPGTYRIRTDMPDIRNGEVIVNV